MFLEVIRFARPLAIANVVIALSAIQPFAQVRLRLLVGLSQVRNVRLFRGIE